MEIISACEVLKHMLVDSHESPEQNADFLMEGNQVHRVREVGELRINNVLEELAESSVERVKVDSSVDYPHQPEILIDGQIFEDLLLFGLSKVVK